MFTFTVQSVDDGEQWQVTADSRDVVMWEKAHKGRTMKTLTENPSMTAYYELAHFAAKRQRLYNGSLNDFIDGHQLVFTVEDDVDPTSGGA